MHAAKALSLKPGSAVTSPLEEESCRAETLALTTSWAVLFGLHSQPGFTRWDRSIKQLGNTSGSHLKKTKLQATLRRDWCCGHLHHCSCSGSQGHSQGSSGPFTVQLFIGFLCSIGKIIMFFIGECLALIVEYIQGNCCGCCFLMFFSFMS